MNSIFNCGIPDDHTMNCIQTRLKQYGSLIPACIVGACAAFFAWYPVSDGDIFWHLATGREIVKNFSIPAIDPFSFTSTNLVWINLHWLYQTIMYGIHALTGMSGILLANSLLFGSAASIAFLAFGNRTTQWLLTPLWIAALYEVRYLVPHRPIVATLLFMALFLWLLERYCRIGRFRYLYLLIPVQILWVNSQGLFLLGPAIFTLFFLGEAASIFIAGRQKSPPDHLIGRKRQRIPVLIGVVLIAASCINPYGIHALSLARRLFLQIDPSLANLFSTTIIENTPLFGLAAIGQVRYIYGVAALTFLALIASAIRPRAVRLSLCLVSIAMLILAIRAQRNIILYIFAILPLLSSMVAPIVEKMQKSKQGLCTLGMYATIGTLVALSFSGVLRHALMLRSIDKTEGIAPFSFPQESVKYIQSHPPKGTLFNADRYGGYLLWNLYPRHKVFVDTRYAIRPKEFFAQYLAIIDNPYLFLRVVEKYSITVALLPTALTDRYYTLARALYENPEWYLIYADGAEALFIRDRQGLQKKLQLDSDETVDSLIVLARKRCQQNPLLEQEALQYLKEFLSKMGFLGSAERVAQKNP